MGVSLEIYRATVGLFYSKMFCTSNSGTSKTSKSCSRRQEFIHKLQNCETQNRTPEPLRLHDFFTNYSKACPVFQPIADRQNKLKL